MRLARAILDLAVATYRRRRAERRLARFRAGQGQPF